MDNIFMIKISLIFLSSLFFSLLINRLFIKFSRNLGIRDINEPLIRWNATAKPAFGGISFFIVFLLAVVFHFILYNSSNFINLQVLGIIAAISIGFLIGLADDAYNTNPTLKFIGQGLCALVLIVSGSYIQLFDGIVLNYVLTFFWVVGLMNSINMFDNMDGVSTVASITALFCMLTVLLFTNNTNTFLLVIIIGLIGALCGFLFFNWHPSKMYMGDSGSQFLGITLASLSIMILWNYNSDSIHKNTSIEILLPLLAFIAPLSDTTTVVINRIREGRSPFIGGKDHTTHHLSYFGVRESLIPLIIAAIGSCSVMLIVIILNISKWSYTHTILLGLYVIFIFLSLFLITQYNNKKSKK